MKCNCLISTEMRYKPCFNGYNGINRSHKNLIMETLREVSPSYITSLAIQSTVELLLFLTPEFVDPNYPGVHRVAAPP